MQFLSRAILALLLMACNADPHAAAQMNAAELLTKEHAKRELRASVAGSDCNVLLIRVENGLDDDLVESIHYGTGDYGAFGGVEQFAQDRGFRAVIYRDEAGHIRTYGATSREEAEAIAPCR